MVRELIKEWEKNSKIIQPKATMQRSIKLDDGYIVISGRDDCNRIFYNQYTLPEFLEIVKKQREVIKSLQVS